MESDGCLAEPNLDRAVLLVSLGPAVTALSAASHPCYQERTPVDPDRGRVPPVLYPIGAAIFVAVLVWSFSRILLAVSSDDNPNDGWFFQAVNALTTIGGTASAADFDALVSGAL